MLSFLQGPQRIQLNSLGMTCRNCLYWLGTQVDSKNAYWMENKNLGVLARLPIRGEVLAIHYAFSVCQ